MQLQYGGAMMGANMMNRTEQVMQHQVPQNTFNAAAFDEEAFARAFEQASEEAERAELEQEQNAAQNTSQDQDQLEEVLLAESAERLMASELNEDQIQDQPRIGADTIYDPTDQNYPQPQHEDHNELAKTAGELLDGKFFFESLHPNLLIHYFWLR